VDTKGHALVDKGFGRGEMRLHESMFSERQRAELRQSWVRQRQKLVHEFQISEPQLAQLRQALGRERFFELGSEYGDNVPDGSVARLRITQGQQSKMVTLLYLGNWKRAGHKRLAEAKRVERIWNLLYSWMK
jgi:hypothetical protein